MAVVSSELFQGSPPGVGETLIISPPQKETPGALMSMAAIAERRLTFAPLPLRVSNGGIDLDINVDAMDEFNRFCKGYEELCMDTVVDSLGNNQVVFGPHIINAAFDGVKNQEPIDGQYKRFSIPDAMVFEYLQFDESGVPLEEPMLKVVGLVEARTGDINGNGKLIGFRNLIDNMRDHPDEFALAIFSTTRGRVFRPYPVQIMVPPVDQIYVDFYSPKIELENPSWRKHMIKNEFEDVKYKLLPYELPDPVNILSSSLLDDKMS